MRITTSGEIQYGGGRLFYFYVKKSRISSRNSTTQSKQLFLAFPIVEMCHLSVTGYVDLF